MKNVLILLEIISTVQPRGLDPKYYAKDVETKFSAFSGEAIDRSKTQASGSDSFSFINNFLSSEKDVIEPPDANPEESSGDLNLKHGELGKDHMTVLKVIKEGVRLDRVRGGRQKYRRSDQ